MSSAHSQVLLDLARGAIAEEFGGPKPVHPPDAAWLDRPAAVFVTLRQGETLRGCVGSLESRRTLFDEVLDRAKAAAFRDTRMPSVKADELARLSIEIAVLSPLEALSARSEAEAITLLRPGVDGVWLSCRAGSAVFIPKMWKQLPEPREFLAQLLKKAGLTHWPADMKVKRFTAEEHPGDGAGTAS